MKRFAVYILTVVFFLVGCKNNVSGSYLFAENGVILWLQLVRTPDSRLTGQIVMSQLRPDGQIEEKSAPITGAVDGENVTLQTNSLFGLSNRSLSGTFDGDGITLAGADVPPGMMKRASLSDYQAQLATLQKRSSEIVAAKTTDEASKRQLQEETNVVSKIEQLIGHMQRFESEADIQLNKIPDAEKRYEAITSKVNTYVTRERQLARNPNAGVERGQLDVAANQVSLNTDQLHLATDSLQRSLDINIAPLAREVSVLEKGCQGTDNIVDSRGSACKRLLIAVPAFDQKYSAITVGLSHLEEVYKREKNTQERLLAEVQHLE